MARERLWALCLKCEHVWLPDKSRGKLRCVECRSRNVLRATINGIVDHVRKEALKQRAERVQEGVCPTCGAKGGVKCRFCKAAFTSDARLQRHVREEHPDKVRKPGGQRKKRAEDLSLEESKEPSIITEARERHLTTAEERRRARGRAARDNDGKPVSGPLREPIHKRIGVKADKLEKIVVEWEKFPHRSQLDINGRPCTAERQNVRWIEDKVRSFSKAHAIYHEVLMKGVECTLPIGYKPME